MLENCDLYITDDKEEIFWFTTSFFAKSYNTQKKLINNFSLTKFSSDFDGDVPSEIISTLVWCYRTYLPDFEKELYQISVELYTLLELIENYSIIIQNEGLGEQHLLCLESMEDNEIWELARRLANLILTTWGMEPFSFKGKIDLDSIGPEIF